MRETHLWLDGVDDTKNRFECVVKTLSSVRNHATKKKRRMELDKRVMSQSTLEESPEMEELGLMGIVHGGWRGCALPGSALG